MHLLATTSGTLADTDEAVDLDQSPADVLILSAADSELAALSSARESLGDGAPSLRLVPLGLLRHNLSVDLWLDKTARHAKLIVARILGGAAYWPYGVEELEALARREGLHLALLPGGQAVDEGLMRRSSLPIEVCEAMRALLAAGGMENARCLLSFLTDILSRGPDEAPPPTPAPLPPAGVWLNGRMRAGLPMRRQTTADRRDEPRALIVFYRALLEGGFTAPVDRLVEALATRGLAPLPVFVTSLKDPAVRAFVEETLERHPPDVVINLTAFATGEDGPLRLTDCPVIQAIAAGVPRETWRDDPRGLGPRDLTMNVALPEFDGRIIGRIVSFKRDSRHDEATQCAIVTYEPDERGIAWTARLAARWAALRRKAPEKKRIAIVLANYPNRDSRIGNGVGLDTPQSTIEILNALKDAGFLLDDVPGDGTALIERLCRGPTNARPRLTGARDPHQETILTIEEYNKYYKALHDDIKKEIEERWGPPQADPFFAEGAFRLPVLRLGNVAVAIQPARGYNIDPAATYHDPALVPPHGYLAFYIWLREVFRADAVIHNGKHGNLEWLPGKALALSDACFPDAVLGPLPHLYPFIVNDPGEGAQAKRRTQAVIIDHLTPPLARAETYGRLAELERLLDEYWQAASMDSRRLSPLRRDILDLAHAAGVDADAGIGDTTDEEEALVRLDAFLCEVKEAQIRNGLHVLGRLPETERELAEYIAALVRVPRADGEGGNASLQRAIATDVGLKAFDPLTADPAAPWTGPRPASLAGIAEGSWRTCADTRERIELLALALVEGLLREEAASNTSEEPAGDVASPSPRTLRSGDDSQVRFPCMQPPGPATRAVLSHIRTDLLPRLRDSARNEIDNLLAGLAGRFVPPGPAGAPSRGRLDVLPTGRNFFSLDPRALPTPAAWRLGRKSAETMLLRHFQEHGEYPRAIGLSCWGTANMRTGGDDIAQALALIGVAPRWDHASGRVTGFRIMPLAELGRPRVDVTLRISGFFRDAFPRQIALFDRAVRAVAELDEAAEDNPIAARMSDETDRLRADGLPEATARRIAGHRVFGAPPGGYGAGLQAMFDENLWEDLADLAETWIHWGAHAYGEDAHGERAEEAFRQRLAGLDAVAHNQDNREHDILDSDDYYQFEGGMAAAVRHLKGTSVPVWHNDHALPERPVTRSLEEEVARIVRARVVNPKWISAMRKHGYKGAFEIAATVDYMFAFAATTGAVKSRHFELVADAFLRDAQVRDWLAEVNPQALADIANRLEEALARGFWRPRANDDAALLDAARAASHHHAGDEKR